MAMCRMRPLKIQQREFAKLALGAGCFHALKLKSVLSDTLPVSAGDSIMTTEEVSQPLGDDDGIEVENRELPRWWKRIFIAAIALCPLYLAFYHGGAEGRSMLDQYDLAIAENTRLQFEEIGELQPDADTIVRYSQKKNWVRVGQIVFKKNCASCHGREGEGKVGPNLTDDVYKNVTHVEDIAKVISNGAGGNAMPAWKTKLHPNEVVLLAAYVASLRNTNADGGKGPDGRKIAPWPEAAPESESDTDTKP